MKNSNISSAVSTIIMFLSLLLSSLLLTNCEKDDTNNPTPQSENYQLGFIVTPSSVYSSISKAPELPPSGDLPNSFFLKIPSTPFDQGQQGSCASCATAMAKSILDHVKYNISYPNNGIIYSPSYLFNQCHSDPNDCLKGSSIFENLEILKNQGICDLSEMPYSESNCTTQPLYNQMNLAASHKIDHYYKIDPISILWIKEYIYIGLPVLVAFQVDNYFKTASKNTIWDSFHGLSLGWHCTLLYGWDDSINAFKMLNSWGGGDLWGNNGTIWVDYDFVQSGSTFLYGKIFREAYIIQNPAVTNKPTADFDVYGSSTTINTNQQISFRDKSTNSPTLWSWSFPGGTPSSSGSQNPTITYSTSGDFSVSLTVNNQSGTNTKTITSYIHVNQAIETPIAQFSTSGSTDITVGSSISFLDQSTKNPTSWSWNFPGGTPSSSNSQNPTVTYSTPGNYNVSLTASNQSGSNTKTITNYIKVSQAVITPIAQFSANGSTDITVGSSISFLDQSTNNPTSWTWNFPGGTPSSSNSQNPTITYSTSGNFNVSLIASNQAGSNSITKTTYIKVTSEQSSILPSLTTNSISNISQSSASSGGDVTSDGNATVTARGVCWSISSNPTTSNSKLSGGSGTGSFISSITGLNPNTTYYVRAYATNSVGTAYGNQQVFTTGQTTSPPTITTSSISNITQNTASSGGNVTSDGNTTVTARGVCWSTSSNPTTSSSKTSSGSGTGSFTCSITGLSSNTTYYVRAYATNSAGTAYGNQQEFTTGQTTSPPTITTSSISNITQNTASSGGNVTSDGNATVTARGVCWSTSSNPTTSSSKTSSGSGTGSFTCSITGLSSNTTYYVRAYATNSAGTAYGNQVSFKCVSGSSGNSITPTDNCSTAPIMNVNTSYTVSINLANYSLGAPIEGASSGGANVRGFWLAFRVPSDWSAYHNIKIFNVSSNFDPVFGIRGGCGTPYLGQRPNMYGYVNLNGKGGSEISDTNIPGSNNYGDSDDTYYIRIYHYYGAETATITFSIIVE